MVFRAVVIVYHYKQLMQQIVGSYIQDYCAKQGNYSFLSEQFIEQSNDKEAEQRARKGIIRTPKIELNNNNCNFSSQKYKQYWYANTMQ